MVDRMKKSLARFSKKERKRITAIMNRIRAGDLSGLDVEKLKGKSGALRVRKGSIRIIFAIPENGDVRFIAIERRSESTYRGF